MFFLIFTVKALSFCLYKDLQIPFLSVYDYEGQYHHQYEGVPDNTYFIPRDGTNQTTELDQNASAN